MNQPVVDDDVFSLFARFDLDMSNYKVFTRPEVSQSLSAESPTALLKQEPQVAKGPAEDRDTEAFVAGQEPIPFLIAPTPQDDGQARIALQNLLRQVKVTAPARHISSKRLAAQSVSIQGAAGGVGKTTVAALLARFLAKSGRRCGILDETGDDTLPMFFGAQRISGDHRRFSALNSLFDPGVRIINAELLEAPDPSLSFIERHFADTASDFDHLIFDHRARSLTDSGAGLTVYVAIPDLGSLAGIRYRLRNAQRKGEQAPGICVLNRFEPASVLHQELLSWYRDNFPHVVVIRQSNLIPEALAEGTTVFDWVPESPASNDLLSCVTLIRRFLDSELKEVIRCL